MYVPNLKKASRNMTKHMFKDKLGQSEFPHHSRYVPNVNNDMFTYNNPSTIIGAMQATNLVKSAEEEVNTKRLLNGMFWNV